MQLQIVVTGASNPKPPAEINVDGLDIRSAGVSRQYQMNNFSVSYSFTYNYTIMPLRTGTFTIPPQTVEVAGKAMKTPPLSLTVADSPGSSTRRRGGTRDDTGAVDPTKIGFVEMVLPKQVAYVGEMIPVQIRLGLNMRAPVDSLGSGMQIAGQGFTTQKMPEPRQTIENINGRSYQVFIFKTAISPVRAGKLEIGPAEIKPVVRVPRQSQQRSLPRSLLDDPLDPLGSFFNDPFIAPSMPKEISLKSQGTTIEVKPLPPNAPPTFNGAVGTFTMKSDANPKKVQVGDPITVTAAITGRGNFDRVTAPALENDAGWHQYPSSDKFVQDDDVGISGSKTFETVVSPKERKDKLPPLVFTFFDPVKETYVSLRSDDLPLRVEGGAAATPTPAVTAAATPPPAAAPTATPTPREQDILHQLTERGKVRQTFAPLYARRSFWLAQLVPLLVLAAFVGWRVRQARLDDREAQRIAQLQHQTAELERQLRAPNGATPHEYLANASRTVQLKTALARNIDPNLVDADAAATAFRLDEQRAARLRQLFEQSDELRYSGAGNGGQTISQESRREILELVENLRA